MQDPDIDIIIDVLEQARLLSIGVASNPVEPISPHREKIIMDLIDEGMLRGETLKAYNDPLMPFVAAYRGINLKGRRYLQELKDYKRDRGFWGNASKAGWVLFGALIAFTGSLLGTYLTSRWHLKDDPKQPAAPAAQVSPTSSP